jgi:hypothetical protein
VTAEMVLARLQRLGVRLTVTDEGQLRYRAPQGVLTPALLGTVRRHREALGVLIRDGSAGKVPTASQHDEDQHLLGAAQVRMWLASRVHDGAPELNIGGAFEVTGRLDQAAFAGAVRATVQRQAALRTSIRERDGLPTGTVSATGGVALRWLTLGAAASPQIVRQAVAEEIAGPFELAAGPLYRVAILELTPERHIVVLTLHHVIGDDHSVRVFGREILDNYELATGRGGARKPLLRRTAHRILAERAGLARSDALTAAVRRRKAALADAPAQRLPEADHMVGVRPGAARTVTIIVDGEALRSWRLTRQAARTTTLRLVLAVVALALVAAGAGPDLLIGVPDPGRDLAEDWEVIGCLYATMIVRLRPMSSPTMADFLTAVDKEVTQAREVRHVAFEELVGRRASAGSGGFVLWVAPYAVTGLPSGAGLSVTPVPSSAEPARHDLRVGVFDQPGKLEVSVTCRTSTVAAPFTRRIATVLSVLLHDLPALTSPLDAAIARLRREARDYPPGQEASMSDRADIDLLQNIRERRRQGTRSARSTVEIAEQGQTWAEATVTAKVPGLLLRDWISGNLDLLRSLLDRHGAALLRGFTANIEDFSSCVAAVAGDGLLEYVNRSTPRARVAGRVFTSTKYPASESIPLHSEQSYTVSWPLIIGFRCICAATAGGQTPLAPNWGIVDALPADLVDRFVARGLSYERWYQPHVDLSWREAFQADRRSQVDVFCRQHGIDAEWHSDEVLRTRQAAQVIIERKAGQPLWFNQAHLFHPAALPDDVRAALTAGAAHLPRNVTFADGEPIRDSDIGIINEAIEGISRQFNWLEDDVLLVDNQTVAHGRRPFRGNRRIEVAMAGTGHD